MSQASVIEFVATAKTERQTETERDVVVMLAARLADGSEVVVLSDRGFSEGWVGQLADDVDVWQHSDGDLEECAWAVGPEERSGEHTDQDMIEGHWSFIASRLAEVGVDADAARLIAVPFRVVWGDRERIWPKGFDWREQVGPKC